MTSQSLPWIDPLELAASMDEQHWVLLHSGVSTNYSGRFSYLACQLAERIESDGFTAFEERLAQPAAHGHAFAGRWFGFFGYGLKNKLEKLPIDHPNWFELPALVMMRFHTVYEFNHDTRSLTCHSSLPIERKHLPDMDNIPPTGYEIPAIASFTSPMSNREYLAKAGSVIEKIHAGELYQANLTRKFIGNFDAYPDHFSIFRRLCDVSPAPYSAYIRLEEQHILSSSPEQFLKITPTGYVETRPIKGTAPRFSDKERDEASRLGLASSVKDRAENLMITDLMRNDLARTCIPGSVRVEQPFEVTTHATIHHMSSTVSGQKALNYSDLELIKGCFPPGSMTGAPKIGAIRLCSELEKLERGLYSGAIGWIDHKGGCELSVVIRTLVMEALQFEFQVGGGIVADSTPEGELEEILFKSKGILRALGLDQP